MASNIKFSDLRKTAADYGCYYHIYRDSRVIRAHEAPNSKSSHSGTISFGNITLVIQKDMENYTVLSATSLSAWSLPEKNGPMKKLMNT
jgi:hypothetical protein